MEDQMKKWVVQTDGFVGFLVIQGTFIDCLAELVRRGVKSYHVLNI
jgi:hypothetical protein